VERLYNDTTNFLAQILEFFEMNRISLHPGSNQV
jgi:hypothetical protein